MRGEIIHGEERALGAHRGDDVLRNGAAVEGVPALAGDAAHALGQCGVVHDLADLGRAAVLQAVYPAALVGFQKRRVLRPVGGNARGDGHAVLGQPNGRLQRLA